MIAEIAAAITGTKTLIGMAKSALDTSREFDKTELRSKIVELVTGMEKLTIDLLEAKSKVAELEAELTLRSTMHFIDGVYWKDAERKDGPYCPACWHEKKEAVPMRRCDREGILRYQCVANRSHEVEEGDGMPAGGWTDVDREMRKSLIPRNNFYYLKLPDGKEDGPFCFRCYDVDKRLVRVMRWGGMMSCAECDIRKKK